MRVLVVNAGSSSLKLRLLAGDDSVERTADVELGPDGVAEAELADLMAGWPAPEAVGHRVVHGGTRFTEPVLVDEKVRAALADLTALAPLHQPRSLAGLDAMTQLLPDVPSVACFDTAFHTTIPAAAATYPVPRDWRERLGVRRYGFHGLSHAWCARRTCELLGRQDLRIVSCHLGAGASLTAVVGGRSVDTTMGFTPLEGLVMATRSGSVDPGLVLWLIEHGELDPHEVATALEKRSGLAGLAGTADMREVTAAAERGEQDAVLALEVYVHRLAGAVAAMAASAGGIDALAFTGGVGEHSATVRERAGALLGFLGVRVDGERNAGVDGDSEITGAGAAVRSVVVASREDLEIARGTREAAAARA